VTSRALLVAALAAAVSSACEDGSERPAEWRYIHAAILRPECATAGCHSRLTALAGLDLSTQESAYTFLVGRVCGAPAHPNDPPGNYVFPGEPERSELLARLRGEHVDVMPPDGPLPAVEIDLIERWILEGASCD